MHCLCYSKSRQKQDICIATLPNIQSKGKVAGFQGEPGSGASGSGQGSLTGMIRGHHAPQQDTRGEGAASGCFSQQHTTSVSPWANISKPQIQYFLQNNWAISSKVSRSENMRDRESARSPKMRKDREVAPNWKRLRRHDCQTQCGILEWKRVKEKTMKFMS